VQYSFVLMHILQNSSWCDRMHRCVLVFVLYDTPIHWKSCYPAREVTIVPAFFWFMLVYTGLNFMSGEISISKRKHVCEIGPPKNWNPRNPTNM